MSVALTISHRHKLTARQVDHSSCPRRIRKPAICIDPIANRPRIMIQENTCRFAAVDRTIVIVDPVARMKSETGPRRHTYVGYRQCAQKHGACRVTSTIDNDLRSITSHLLIAIHIFTQEASLVVVDGVYTSCGQSCARASQNAREYSNEKKCTQPACRHCFSPYVNPVLCNSIR